MSTTSPDPSTTTPILTIIIRFAVSIPDLRLPIHSPQTTNAATLCTWIRPHLPQNLSTCPLRLIHAGALLSPSTPLSSALRLSLHHQSLSSYESLHGGHASQQQQPQQQIYLHCSISSDTHLTAAQLEAESKTAGQLSLLSRDRDGTKKRRDKQRRLSDPTTRSASSLVDDGEKEFDGDEEENAGPAGAQTGNDEEDEDILGAGPASNNASYRPVPGSQSQNPQNDPHQDQTSQPARSISPPPQGFDRLLSAGLTAAEVASLRTQFLAIQSHTHTPDSMPTAAQMRRLEERWLDAGPGSGSGGPDNSLGGSGGEGGSFENNDEDDDGTGSGGGGGLEDMLWGNLMGFFWAVGAVVWLLREEGVWSRRRQVGVVTGFLVNLAFWSLRS